MILNTFIPLSYLGVFDLKSCYFHVKIHKDHCTYFGIQFPLGGKPTYMVYEYLPFGLSSAVHCITKIWKPMIAYFQLQNIPVSVYIDDGLFSASSPEAWNHRRNFIWQSLSAAGWTIAEQKSDALDSGSKSKQYLGFVVNTVDMKLFLPSHKLEELRILVTDFLPLSATPPKQLAKVIGKVSACIPSHGPIARICTRSGYIDLQSHVDNYGWKGMVMLSQNTKREFALFLDVMNLQNGHPFSHHLTDLKVETIFANAVAKNATVPCPKFGYNAVVASDASDFKVACQWLEGPVRGQLDFTLSEKEMATSSGERELLAMLKSVKHFKEVLDLKNVNFIWATDSENLVSFVTKGSPKPHIHAHVVKIYQLCSQMKCTIDPVHLRRTDCRIQDVDLLSKVKDTDNWSIDTFSFNQLHQEFSLTLDVFADSNNKKLPLFMSKNYEEGTLAVDAFSSPWQGMVWLCPPTKLLARVAKRVRQSQCKGLVLLPNWPASDFFNEFFEANYIPRHPFTLVKEFQPFILQNEHARNTPLYGVTKFTFFVLYFNTTV